MTADDHARGAHLFGEVRGRPHRRDLRFEALGERKTIERPIITVNHLTGLTRSDINQLGQVNLVSAAVITQGEVDRVEDRGVRDQSPRLR